MVLQFVLMAVVLALGVLAPGWPEDARWWLKVLGAVVAVAGAAVVAAAVRTLGSGLTPFPRPASGGALVETGPYAVVRHPVYSGGVLVFGGIALALSPWALVGVAALAVTWMLKSRVEERFLADRYPGYADYCERTRWRLVPFVY